MQAFGRDVGIVDRALRTSRPAEDDQDANLSSELQAAFGENAKRQRVALGLKQSEVSERSGIAQPVISKIENGQVNLTLRQMTRLARVLDGDVTSMLRAPSGEDPGGQQSR